ncbi:MAG TPA: glycoside hydrolase family 95 protein, partial [Dyadobacter sp.]|nr:glycoside hydrolase family 95 protein [Dyadobacter sp.]
GEIRTLLNNGKQKEAEKLAFDEFMGDPVRQMAYQPFGDLYMDFSTHADSADYHRELDLSTGISTVRYQRGGATYTREVFASYPAKAIYVHLKSDKKAGLDFGVRLDALHDEKSVDVKGNELTLQVKVQDGALYGFAKVKVISDGKISIENGSLKVKNANNATLILSAATNYIDYKTISGEPQQIVSAVLAKAPGYEQAREQHIQDYQKLFSRFDFKLPSGTNSSLPTDQRLVAFKSNPSDPSFLALYVQYARYLLIASSRPGSHPANLQGKWNEKLKPSWDSKYTVNINTEMNYWPAEMANLSECHEPLFGMIKDLSATGAEVAKEYYDAPGWLVHHNTDVWRGAAPINASNHGIWVTGGAWLSLHLWEHYRFTHDKAFLKTTGYPLMKKAAEFFTSFLVKDPKTGYLISTPSNSPETGGLVAGPTMDHQIIRGLFQACIESSAILNTDLAFAEKLKDLKSKIAPNQIGRAGQLQEWMTDIDDTTSRHRHVSHLWGVYPGEEITPSETPELLNAAKKSLEFRGDDGTGWSLAWKINYWARFLDGDHAYTMIQKLFNPIMDASVKKGGGGSYPNLFDAHPPFQIDGNFGGAAGILETLVQSHLGEIHLLPALQSALPEGKVSGLITRGAFELDMSWKDKQLERLKIKSKAGGKCVVRYKDKIVTIATEKGKTYQLDGLLNVI